MNRLVSLFRLSSVGLLAATLLVAGFYLGCGGGGTTNNNNNTNNTNNNNNGNNVNNNNNNVNNNNNNVNNNNTDQCKGDGDCPPGQSCKDDAGRKVCKEDATQNQVDSVEIVNGGGVIRQGQKRKLEAVALNKSKVRLTGTFSFKWSSSAADTIAVDAASGELTGGSKSGDATITVEVEGKKATTTIGNLGEVAAGKSRVIVLDNKGSAVVGAKVKVGAGEGDTDAKGVVEIAGQTPPYDVHVFHKDYGYFSAFGVGKTDLFIQLIKVQDKAKAGGTEGDINFDALQALFGISADDWVKYTVDVGIVGLSLSANLLELSFDLILGESVPATLPVVNQQVDLPGGVVLAIGGKGKPTYKALGEDGNRILWGFGGKFQLTELLPLIPADTKNINIAEILVKAKPLLEKMAYGYSAGVTVQAGKIDKKTLTLRQKLTEKTSVNVSGIPTVKGTDGKDVSLITIGLAGAILPGVGMIPTGLMFDQGAGTAKFDVTHAKRESALAGGKFAMITLALTLPIGTNPPPLFIFGDIQLFDTAPTSVTVSKFAELPKDAKFDPASRKLTDGKSSDASMYHFTFTGKSGKTWTVVYASGKDSFTLPAVPSGFDDPIDAEGEASFRAVLLSNGQTMDTLLEFNAINMDRLTDVLKGFCNITVYKKPKQP